MLKFLLKLVKFSEYEELVKAIKLSEENSKKKNTKIMSIEELKDELGL